VFTLLCFSHGLIAVQFGSDVFGSVFGVVKFPNAECYVSESSGSEYGTCYTASECSELGGTAYGTCAKGYGVCCIFSLKCGDVSSQNNTYMIMGSTRTLPINNPCIYKICPMHENICRIRFDFFTFDIAQPALSGLCATDSFVITAPEGGGTPVFCGRIFANSLYVDSDGSGCSEAIFSYTHSTEVRERFYRIRERQYDCNDEYLSGPKGCLQYFTNFTSNRREVGGIIHRQQAFSFNGAWTDPGTNQPLNVGRHLANQDYNMCWRRDPGVCFLCFKLGYGDENAFSRAGLSAGTDTQYCTSCSTDYIAFGGNGVVPCYPNCDVPFLGEIAPPLNNVNQRQILEGLGHTRICGEDLSGVLCTASNTPFRARFVTNSEEIGEIRTLTNDAATFRDPSIGFRFDYWAVGC